MALPQVLCSFQILMKIGKDTTLKLSTNALARKTRSSLWRSLSHGPMKNRNSSCSRGFISRFHGWRSYRDEMHVDDALPYIIDGDHHPGQSSAGTDFLPRLTHGNVMALRRDLALSLATTREHYKSLGFEIPSKLGDIFDHINAPPTTWKKCAGNGMHLMAIASWMSHIMACCVRHDPHIIPPAIKEEDEED